MEGWIELSCPYCRARFRIKEAYAHLKGRCPVPSCGFRIDPIRRKPVESTFRLSDAEEPLGLVPLDDDEWPEPAVLVARDEGETYGVAESATTIPLAEPVQPSGTRPVAAKQSGQPAGQPPSPRRQTPPVREASPTPASQAQPPPSQPVVEYDILGEPIIRTSPTVQSAGSNLPQSEAGTTPTAATPPNASSIPLADQVLLETQEEKPTEDADIGAYRLADLPLDGASGPATGRSDTVMAEAVSPQTGPEAATSAAKKASEPDLYSPYQLSDAELEPQEPPPVPLKLFWDGVWNFALRPKNLLRLLVLTAGWSVVGLLVALIRYCYSFSELMGHISMVFGGLAALLASLVTGAYAARTFLHVLTETANGADEIEYPEMDVQAAALCLAKIAWLFGVGLFLPYYLLSQLGFAGVMFFVVLGPLVSSIVILSVLSKDAWYWVINPDVLAMLRKRPDVIPPFYVYAFVIILAWLITDYFAALHVVLVPVAAGAFSYGWLTWARVLGRAGYALTHEIKPEPKRRRKRKKKGTRDQSSNGVQNKDGSDGPEVIAGADAEGVASPPGQPPQQY